MLGDERPQPGKAEHFTCRVVRLDESIAVEEGRFAGVQNGLFLLIVIFGISPKGIPLALSSSVSPLRRR